MSENKAGNDSYSRLLFIQQFLRHPLQIGSVIPSSRFLEQRIVEAAELDSARLVVELGPGTGGTTRAILRALPPAATLLSIDINPHFLAMVARIEDKRLIPHLGSACDLDGILSSYHLPAPDAVISGIPFSTMDRRLGSCIIETVRAVLLPEGRFVAYQASDRVVSLCQPILGTGESTTVLLNIPPMQVHRWEKREC